MRLDGGKTSVLVNRGWVPAGPRRENVPEIVTPPGHVTVEGFGQEHAPRVLAVGPGRQGRVWSGVALEEFAQWSGLELQPVFLEQHSTLPDGLVREWPAPDFGIDRHTSYAMQWYLIALLSVAIFFGLSVKHE
jgi:cytochrome oxidase assembly protein ShyY1